MAITRKGTRTMANTSTSTVYTSNKITNINTNYIYTPPQPSPFSLEFNWNDKAVNISLKNGNDVFKLANGFMEWLDKNEIEYNVKTSGKKKNK